MPDLSDGFVAVGVTGSVESRAAVQYAARAAQDRGTSLLAVHAAGATEPRQVGPRRGLPGEDPHELLARVLDEARLPPSLSVRQFVSPAPAAEVLRRAATRAALVVLGRHRFQLSDLQRHGSVVSTVSAQSRCPVVVTPARSPSPGFDGTVAPVVVAVDAGGDAEAALRMAFTEAERRDAPVTVLQALPSHLSGSRWDEVVCAVEGAVDGQRFQHPGTAVRLVRSTAPSVESLVTASRSAAVLVIARTRHHGRLVSWKRSAAHALLDRTQCPLLVVPQGAAPGVAEDDVRVLIRNGC